MRRGVFKLDLEAMASPINCDKEDGGYQSGSLEQEPKESKKAKKSKKSGRSSKKKASKTKKNKNNKKTKKNKG